MTDLKTRARAAAVRYLEMQGKEVLDDDFEKYIVFKDGDMLVFSTVKVKTDNLAPVNKGGRRRFERVAAEYLQSHPCVTGGLRLDELSMVVVGEDRALLRHAVNVINMD